MLAWKASAFALAQTGAVGGLAAVVAEHQPDFVFARANAEHDAVRGLPSVETLARVAAAARRAPLAAEPFLYSGMRAATAGDSVRALRLLEAARARDPRLRLVRLLLIEQYLRASRIEDAVAEMRVLARLSPETSPLMVKALAQLVLVPDLRGPVIAVVRRDPALLDALLSQLVATETSPDFILELAENSGGAADASQRTWPNALVNALIAQKAYRLAAELWARFNRVDPHDLASVYDRDFKGLAGKPPFNWTLTSDASGAAERMPGGGLSVDYYGRQAGEFASQLLLLRPGAYSLGFTAAGQADGKASHLVWQLRCVDAPNSLIELPVETVAAAPRRIGANFAVPSSGCDAQRLALAGVASEFPREQIARITGLHVVRQGGQQ